MIGKGILVLVGVASILLGLFLTLLVIGMFENPGGIRVEAPLLANVLKRELSSCSPPAAERPAAASWTPQCTPALYRPLPPLSESICPYESGTAPSPRSAAAPGACHPSAVSGRSPGRFAAHIPGKASPASSCSARPCPAVRPLRTSIPSPASRTQSSPSAARSPFDSRCVPWPRTPPQTSATPQSYTSSCAYG